VMHLANAASIAILIEVKWTLKSTGTALIKFDSNAKVLELRFFKSCNTRAGTPPIGRPAKAAFFPSRCVRAFKIVGSKFSMEFRRPCASLSEIGPAALTSNVLWSMVFPMVTASLDGEGRYYRSSTVGESGDIIVELCGFIMHFRDIILNIRRSRKHRSSEGRENVESGSELHDGEVRSISALVMRAEY